MNINVNELQFMINKTEEAGNQAWLLKTLGAIVHPADGVHPRDRLLVIRLALQQALEALDRIDEQQEAESDNC